MLNYLFKFHSHFINQILEHNNLLTNTIHLRNFYQFFSFIQFKGLMEQLIKHNYKLNVYFFFQIIIFIK